MLPQNEVEKLSPMMKQYLKVKEQHDNAVLFFRLGDFYEMFFDDAKLASKELDITLTGKDCGLDERAPMCGVPYHSCEAYIARLIARGYNVAICEQTEDPAAAKGLVQRDVVRVITPGTVIEDSMLETSQNNYLAAMILRGESAALCFTDTSTGQLRSTEIYGSGVISSAECEFGRFMPKEILLNNAAADNKELTSFIKKRLGAVYVVRPDDDLHKTTVTEHFKGNTPEDLGLSGLMTEAVGCTLQYLYETQRAGLSIISEVMVYRDDQYMKLDLSACRNLELTTSLQGGTKGTLLSVLDRTKTAMGKRLLRGWIEQPLTGCPQILLRQSAVAELKENSIFREHLGELFAGTHDLERLMSRVMYGSSNPKELISLSVTLSRLPDVKEAVSACKSPLLMELAKTIDPLTDVHDLIVSTLNDDPPMSLKDGNVIRDGFSEEIDSLRGDMQGGTGLILDIQEKERERSGIKSLKIGYNKIFGYYIEVTNSYKSMVPEDYIRKQTLAGCERYITEELKTLEGRILGAKDRSLALEQKLFDELRNSVSREQLRIIASAGAVAQLDVLRCLAEAAAEYDYCRPDIRNDGRIEIKNGRHPVIERLLDLPFVPNDTVLDTDENRSMIITGPNMAGKSTFMRQVALITLMAQMGSFVPASSARIGVCDAVFTRVGAADDIAGGRSTFMVEMNEVPDSLKNATRRSRIILDEIGRGTSTFDGMSMARAVLEHVSNKRIMGAKTLFATHYHELTELESLMEGVKNYNIAVKKRGDDITFLRRIVRGAADDSYGIEVAKLAGIPDSVINRAKAILKTLEQHSIRPATVAVPEAPEDDSGQMTLGGQQSDEFIEEIRRIDVETLTPIESLNTLYQLISKAKKL